MPGTALITLNNLSVLRDSAGEMESTTRGGKFFFAMLYTIAMYLWMGWEGVLKSLVVVWSYPYGNQDMYRALFASISSLECNEKTRDEPEGGMRPWCSDLCLSLLNRYRAHIIKIRSR